MSPVKPAARIGAGVLGGAWVAHFALAGVDVKIFDPHPARQRINVARSAAENGFDSPCSAQAMARSIVGRTT